MDIQPHIERDMALLGCNNGTKIALNYRLYIHLVDIMKAYDVEYCYNEEINELYCLARPSKLEKVRIYIPRPASKTMNMKEIKDLQLQLCTVETGPSVNIAFIESDTTLVIYNFEAGLPTKDAPSPGAHRSQALRRNLIDHELDKRMKTFMQEALDGGDVDDDVVLET